MKNHYKKWRFLSVMSAFILITANSLFAQVAAYNFSSTSGTYTPITGGLLLGNTSSDDQRFVDPAVPLGGTGTTGVGIPIGFDFGFNGTIYDRIGINNNGWIGFGSSTLSPAVNINSSSSYTPLSATSTATPTHLRNRVAAIGRDLAAQAGSELRVETIGTAPYRTCVIQFTNYKKFGTTGTGDNYNFQIRLNETTNVVEIVYGTFVNNANSLLAHVGLGGITNADYNNRTTTTDWSATTAGVANNATCTATAAIFPASGQTFVWSPQIPTPPAPTQLFASTSCVTGTDLDVVGTPPTDVVWYWQTAPYGTDMTNLYAGPFNVTANGTYYLRAYNTVLMDWSYSSSQVTVTDMPTETDPPAPIADANPACNATQITMPAPPANVEYYWQGTTTGTSNSTPASAPYDVTSTGTYYVTAYNTVSQCWSNSVGTAVTVSTVAPPVPTPGQTVYNYCSGTVNMPVDATVASGTLEWFDAATAGNLLGTGSPFETVGTTVLPDPNITGTYDFYVGSTNGCQSTRTLVQVVIADVLVDITALDETCTNYANGTFFVSNVYCGNAPFTFAVDGGAFGSAPTDLTAGTYSVVVMDNGGLLSAPMDVVVGTNETTIPFTPTSLDTIVYACTSDLSVPINAEGTTLLPGSLTTTFAAGNGCTHGNMFNIAANSMDVILESFDINLGTSGNVLIYYKPGTYVGSETTPAAWTLVGTYPVAGIGVQNVDFADFTIPAGQTYGIYVDADLDYTNLSTTYSNADITVTTGAGLCTAFSGPINGRTWNGTVYYSATVPGTVEWYDAPSTASTQQGAGSPFETVGTPVLPTMAAGVYPFYAFTNNNGCYSVDPLLITVNVNNVKVDLDSVDASCNNQANGTFVLAGVDCGTPPFTYSVNGGAFGPAPTNLTPGIYTVEVQDNNGDVSAVYYVTIEDADAPSGVYMDTITDDGGVVAWVSNGTETSWYVEWGLPGFTPGTGSEIGSATAADTFYLITGLMGNEDYDVYVAANCGPTEVVGDWTLVSFTTECSVFTLPFNETFEDDSDSRICWKNGQEVGTADWTYQTGSSGGTVLTAYEGTKNARFVSLSGTNSPVTKLISPRFDFSGQDSVALTFAYAQENWVGDQNITKVYVKGQNSAWTEIQSYNSNVSAWTVDTLYLSDTVYQVAFEGINNFGRANVIDDVQFMPCTLVPGTDGAVDVCRADGTVDLNTVITRGEFFGKWYFQNQTFITNDSIAEIALLPAGTHNFYYIVETPCAADTTIASITVFNASSAGNDGVLTVCQNEPVDLLSGLTGLVDHGGTWYDPSNNAMSSSQIMASSIPGQFNYDYIVSNGVCGPDTANVVLNVSPTCDWLNIAELGLEAIELYPNPTSGMIYISNEGSTEVFSYELTDLNGKVIASKANAINGTETTSIDLGKLEPGVYLIKVANDNVEHTFRVIKQ